MADPEQNGRGFDQDGDKITQCLIFLPCVTFGVAADLQIIISTRHYQPVAFAEPPFRHSKTIMLALGVAGLLMSAVSYLFCFIVFGGLNDDPSLRKWVFICFIAKAVIWSPFLGLEYYDMLFEQIYNDVQFQLNVIKPDGSRSASPRQESPDGPRTGKKLQAIPEHSQEAQLEISEEENERSNENLTQRNDDQNYNSSLLKPTSTGKHSLALQNAASTSQDNFKPLDVRDIDVDDQAKNRLIIQRESQVTRSLNDNLASLVEQRNRRLDLTEQERQIRRAHGLDSKPASQINSQLEPASPAVVDEASSEGMPPQFGA